MIKTLKGQEPNIDKNAFIAETADVIGKVKIGEGSSIWYGSVLRGDIEPISIGVYTNIQDNCVVHTENNIPTKIGDYTVVGHSAIIHGAQIGSNCLIGMGAIILNNAVVGDNCIIAAGSLVSEGKKIPSNSMVMGTPGRIIRSVTQEEVDGIKTNAIRYNKLFKDHLD